MAFPIKRLVFHFYFNKDYKKSPIIKLHLKLLSYYSHIFDQATFVLVPYDVNDIDTIKSMERDILDCGFMNVTFKIQENTIYRESLTFKEEIIDKMKDLDGITFFGHSKGIGNEMSGKYDMNNITTWVIALYYLSLNFMDEVENNMVGFYKKCYGPLRFVCENPFRKILHDWHYSGTFMWLNCQAIDNLKRIDEYPQLADRFYSEDFLGTVLFPEETYSHGDYSLITFSDTYLDINAILDALLWNDEEKENFRTFVKMISEK